MAVSPESRSSVFSMDPYIDAGGNYGAQLQINQMAAGKIYQGAAFTRDIYVGKRQAKEERSADVQSDVLVLKKFSMPKFPVLSRPLHDLEATNSAFSINVDDEALTEKADEYTKANFKKYEGLSGQDISRQQFLEQLNREVASGLKEAVNHERLSFVPHLPDYFGDVAFSYLLYEQFQRGSFDNPSILFYPLYMAWRTFFVSSAEGLEPARSTGSTFIEPVVSPNRIIQGYWQIMRNRGKLIVERNGVEDLANQSQA